MGAVTPLAIRGWGSVSALGTDTRTAVVGLREGRRGIAPARSAHFLVPVAGEPPLVGEVPLDVPLAGRARAMVDVAVDEALAAAGPSPGRIGVFVGTTSGFFVEGEVALHARRRVDPAAPPIFTQRGPGEVAEVVAARVGATGPVLAFSMACTSSAAALASAATHLRAGTCDRAVVVGFDPLTSLTVHGFRSLMLCDPRPCRPFDVTRAGLQPGEGCGVLVVDRGGEGPFHLLGADNCIDTTHLTASATDGSTVERVLRGALARSGLVPGDVVDVKAHGTGTPDNDLAEGRGLARVFEGAPPPFASLKGALGHTLGAAGALEVVLWLAALSAGFVPGSVGYAAMDPEIGVAPTTAPAPARRGAHLFAAFGFGGSCVALAVADA